jgi:hypothetical protein
MKVMTYNYSQWFNYHVKKRTGKRIKAEHGESIQISQKMPYPQFRSAGVILIKISKPNIQRSEHESISLSFSLSPRTTKR